MAEAMKGREASLEYEALRQFELELVQDQGSRNGTANDNVSHAAPGLL